MPVCIILVWFLASTGLANLDKEKKRKLMIGSVGFGITCLLVMFHYRSHIYHNILDVKRKYLGGSPLEAINSSELSAQFILQTNSTPVTHIAYIKTHKTGSSTIWSIIVNFALNHNLTIALPAAHRGDKLGWPKFFTPSYATPPKPDVLCHHSRFSKAMLEYMPKDTVYLTSLRDPAEQLLLVYNYFSASSCLNMTFRRFIVHSDKKRLLEKCSSYYDLWLMNGQMFDLGLKTSTLSSAKQRDRNLVMNKISELDKKLSLVLILEKLEESLILLRDLLNWSTEDIIYLHSSIKTSMPNLSKSSYTETQRAREWNWADTLLYNHFKRKLDAAVNKNKEYYKKEIEHLRHRIKLWTTRCVKEVIPGTVDASHMTYFHIDNVTYTLTAKGKHIDRCVQLAMGELAKNSLLIAGKPVSSTSLLEDKGKLTP